MKEFTLKLNAQQIQMLSKALMNMKYRDIAGLINDINVQLAAQAQNPDPIPSFVGDVETLDQA